MIYYLTRANDLEPYMVTESNNGSWVSSYPHTDLSDNFDVIEQLINTNDPSIVFCGQSEIPQLTIASEAASEVAEQVRQERNLELKESDWTQLADAQVDKSAWATYRQLLRDVPSQSGFPFNITWPTQP